MPGRPADSANSRARALAVGAGRGLFWTFFLLSTGVGRVVRWCWCSSQREGERKEK